MSKDSNKYFNFPLCFLQLIKTGKQALEDICNWAIINYSQKIKYSSDIPGAELLNVAKQAIYRFYHDDAISSIETKFCQLISTDKFEHDEVYQGFAPDGKFDPGNVQAILNEFENDQEFKEDCILQYQHDQALSILNVEGSNIESRLKRYNELQEFYYSFITNNGPDAWTSVKTTYLFDARDGKLPVDLFRLVAAVKSIIRKRNFCQTYKVVILRRMFGCKGIKEFNSLHGNVEDLPLFKRKTWDKLLRTAEQRNLLTYLPTTRGYYVSIKYDEEKLRKEATAKLKQFSKKKVKVHLYTSN